MADTPRLNGVIAALEQGKPAFVSFCAAEIGVAQAMNAAPYDGVVFEMEHRPYDIRALRDCLQYMLDRRQILQRGTLAPAVTPFVRIPPNGGEASQWVAKQVLDQGVYGIVWPHVSTVDEARNAVTACRYPRPRSAQYFEPRGSARRCARCGGALLGAVAAGILFPRRCLAAQSARRNPGRHHVRGSARDQKFAEDARGGSGDRGRHHRRGRSVAGSRLPAAIRSSDCGLRQWTRFLAICKQYNVPCGHPHVDTKNVEALLEKGFRYLMPAPVYSYAALELGRKACGRS